MSELPDLTAVELSRLYGDESLSPVEVTTAVLARIGWPEPDSEATVLIAQLVGAVALARSVGKGAQSDAILDRTREAIIARYGLEAGA